MLGYVKCDDGELLVKHHRLYGAVYCGLCHSMRKNHARALLPLFQYDFVFLALLRMLVTGEEMQVEPERCLFHPFQKNKKRIADNDALRYTVFASLALTAGKMQDDLADGDAPFFRRLLIRLWFPMIKRALHRKEKESDSLRALSLSVFSCLEKGREGEARGESLDFMCSSFAHCLALLFSYGTQGKEQRILQGIGDRLGRFLYTLDALDDMKDDLASGAFNPLLENGALPSEKTLFRIDLVMSFYVEEMKNILNLAEGDSALYALCENIICRALPAAVHNIIKPKNGENDERSL